MRILLSGLAAGLTLGLTASAAAQVSPFVEAQIQAAVVPCTNKMSEMAGLSDAEGKPVAEAALPICYESLQKLDAFEKANGAGLNREEAAYFYYMGGSAIWMTAGAETVKNDSKLNPNICMQVVAAESTWRNVKAEPGSSYDEQMRSNKIRNILLPICEAAYTPTPSPSLAPGATETQPNP